MLYASATGDYALIVTTGCGSDTSSNTTIQPGTGLIADFQYGNQPEFVVEFKDNSISGATWVWDFGDGSPTSTEQNPIHQYASEGTFNVTMIVCDLAGCCDTVTMPVNALDPDFFIPNVFSPNDDGINDLAQTNFSNLLEFHFRIYDRWGRVVFETTNPNQFWDGKVNGKDAPESVYFYQMIGKKTEEKELKESGNITLVR